MFRWILVLAALAFLAAPTAAAADPAPAQAAPAAVAAAAPPAEAAAPETADCSDAEIKAEVPALGEFHEVIYPLWHDAWPSQNFGLMKELLPQIKAHVTAVQKAELPGILRDKQAKWDEGVAGVAASAGALEQALAKDDQQGALDAAEALHAGFEGLVRTVRPRLKELDAYHQVLYRIYHYDWPQKNRAALRQHAAELVASCAPLQTTAVPKRFAAKEAQLRAEFAALCAATGELQALGDGADEKALGAAVEKVHARYQACESMFD